MSRAPALELTACPVCGSNDTEELAHELAGVYEGEAADDDVMLAHNNLLGFPYRHGFTVGALERLLVATGFEVVSTYGDTLVPIADEWTRRWGAAEERLVKGVLKVVATVGGAERAPWFEMYAVRTSSDVVGTM